MERIGIRDFRDHLSAYIRKVRGGEVIVILDHGRPVAHVSPAQYPEEAALQRMAAEGLLEWGGGKPAGPAAPIKAKGPVSDLVKDMRR